MAKYYFYAAILYLAFVVYGSLVPLVYQSLPWEQALEKFKNIPYLDLGMGSRADWIANIVLYVPLAFLWSVLLNTARSPVLRIVGQLLVLGGCLLLAVGVEFCQLFFPPRTVSINDLVAESLGTVLGLLIANLWGQPLVKLTSQHLQGSELSVKSLIKLYLLAYLLLSLFPFDFVASFAELEIKLNEGSDHLFISFESCQHETLRCLLKLLVEIIVLLPLGGLLYLLPHTPHKGALAILLGFFIGITTETIQLFLISGIAQGLSVLTRMAGIGLGLVMCRWLMQQKLSIWQKRLKPLIVIAMILYLPLIFIITGGLHSTWLPADAVSEKLTQTQFLPFYYFYYTTETIALVSFISNVGLYIPVGLAFWLWNVANGKKQPLSWIWVGLVAVILSTLIETEKLFLTDKHPDPTDVCIAFWAAAGTYLIAYKAQRWFGIKSSLHLSSASAK